MLARRTYPAPPFDRSALAAQHGTAVPQPHAPARFRHLRRSAGQAVARADRPWRSEYSWTTGHRMSVPDSIPSLRTGITVRLLPEADWCASTQVDVRPHPVHAALWTRPREPSGDKMGWPPAHRFAPVRPRVRPRPALERRRAGTSRPVEEEIETNGAGNSTEFRYANLMKLGFEESQT